LVRYSSNIFHGMATEILLPLLIAFIISYSIGAFFFVWIPTFLRVFDILPYSLAADSVVNVLLTLQGVLNVLIYSWNSKVTEGARNAASRSSMYLRRSLSGSGASGWLFARRNDDSQRDGSSFSIANTVKNWWSRLFKRSEEGSSNLSEITPSTAGASEIRGNDNNPPPSDMTVGSNVTLGSSPILNQQEDDVGFSSDEESADVSTSHHDDFEDVASGAIVPDAAGSNSDGILSRTNN
jgi:hypothetical protein